MQEGELKMPINKNIFIHESDQAALQALQAIPGFSQVMKAYLNAWNEKLMYINGLPYYRFHGYGRNTREFIDGFALAVNIAESVVSDELFKQHAAFCFE